MKRDNLSDTLADYLFMLSILCVSLGLMLFIFGCIPHAAPIDIMPERIGPTPQRTIDLQHPCERCGDVATENVSEVADEQNWRCDKCKPRDVRPRRVPRRKLETQWVMLTPPASERNRDE